eukprot:TRINITY_DN22622_c0_g1_i1.p1 TRINITY_DN22622_c0_g1~~TRINITY_DN22622_c0_g1_i1.p1  ORF type:complete len:564 (+),score=123.15 TRINITY_DN22622_c0_g1_i1:143-1834(+)
MCGILIAISSPENTDSLRKQVVHLVKRLRHRGPDWSGICVQKRSDQVAILAHERLAIVDPVHGAQPLYDETGQLALCVNGEIYNHQQLRRELKATHKFSTESDCEVILYLYKEVGAELLNRLSGDFAFVLSDASTGAFLAARDPIGVCPLYIGWDNEGGVWFSSEMKALADVCQRFQEFPPGHYWSNESSGFTRWYNPPWVSEQVPCGELDLAAVRGSLEKAVKRRLMADVPYGVLLSGGLDSSLVASIASRQVALLNTDGDNGAAEPRLQSFSIGLKNSPDLVAAREVATFLNTVHHEVTFTIQEGLDALADVIYHLETYDVTSIRASTPMYLLTRKIKALGVKMVLSGEGADEIFGGYLYFHKAPSKEKFHVETCQKLKALSKYDCLRANKAPAAWGVEVRVPFLDRDFLDVAMAIDPDHKMIRPGKIEKYILRKAFDDEERPFLPKAILWRQKEQFSDGVGYGWIDGLKDHADKQVTNEMMKTAAFRFPHNPPQTKEAYLYRSIFHQHYPQECAAQTVPGGPSIACSTAAAVEWELSWKGNLDPSGRSVGVHASTTCKAD